MLFVLLLQTLMSCVLYILFPFFFFRLRLSNKMESTRLCFCLNSVASSAVTPENRQRLLARSQGRVVWPRQTFLDQTNTWRTATAPVTFPLLHAKAGSGVDIVGLHQKNVYRQRNAALMNLLSGDGCLTLNPSEPRLSLYS